MTEQEATDMGVYLSQLFDQAEPVKLSAMKGIFLACNLPIEQAKDIAKRLWFASNGGRLEPFKLAEMLGVQNPGRVAAEYSIQARQRELQQWEDEYANDQAKAARLASLPPERLAELREKALAKIEEPWLRKALSLKPDPLASPTLVGFMLSEAFPAKIETAGVS